MPARHLHPTPSILFVLRADARAVLWGGFSIGATPVLLYFYGAWWSWTTHKTAESRGEGRGGRGATFSFHSCSSVSQALLQEDASFDSFHRPSLIHKPTRARTSEQGGWTTGRETRANCREIQHFLPTEPIILLAILNSDEECVVVVVCRAGKLAMVEQRARLKSNRFKGAWLDWKGLCREMVNGYNCRWNKKKMVERKRIKE